MTASSQKMRVREATLGLSLAAMAVTGCIVLLVKVPARWMQGIAILSGLSSVGAAIVLARSQLSYTCMAAPDEAETESALSSNLEVRTYSSRWTMSGNDKLESAFLGRATAFALAERTIIRQEEQAGGTYVLELKHIGDSVSGVWWFYGGHPPQGMFRGSISPNDGSIQATWQSPNGEGGGNWSLIPIDERPGQKQGD